MCIEKELLDKRKYPTFARTATAGYDLIFTMYGLLSYYKWKKVSVISHDLFPYKKLFEEFNDSYKGEIASAHIIEGAAHYNYSKHYHLVVSYLREISNKSKSELFFFFTCSKFVKMFLILKTTCCNFCAI